MSTRKRSPLVRRRGGFERWKCGFLKNCRNRKCSVCLHRVWLRAQKLKCRWGLFFSRHAKSSDEQKAATPIGSRTHTFHQAEPKKSNADVLLYRKLSRPFWNAALVSERPEARRATQWDPRFEMISATFLRFFRITPNACMWGWVKHSGRSIFFLFFFFSFFFFSPRRFERVIRKKTKHGQMLGREKYFARNTTSSQGRSI